MLYQSPGSRYLYQEHCAEVPLTYRMASGATTTIFVVVPVGTVANAVPGKLRRDRAGEFYIVPQGVGHRTSADAKCPILVLEPISTRNTESVEDPKFTTVDVPI
jgi:hypothetical protein